MKFRKPDYKMEDELAAEYLKKMEEEDDFYGNWPVLRYDDPDFKIPKEPTKKSELKGE